MSVAILGKGKKVALKRRHARIRKRISGTPERPRLVVTRSNRHMVAQVVDDTKGITLVSASTLQADFAGFEGTKTEAAKKVGRADRRERPRLPASPQLVFDPRWQTSTPVASQPLLMAPAREVLHCERQRNEGNPSG